ncbi:MAG: hypothetical protein ACOYYU_10330 [Chloroflexota bacterium]
MPSKITEKRKQAGRLGGLATLARHGSDHFRAIGRKGAFVTWTRYHLAPAGLNDFAMTNRQTGEVVAYLSGRRP